MISLTQQGICWNGSLSKELCRLGWLVGIFLIEFTDMGRHTSNVGGAILGLGPGLNEEQKSSCGLASINTFVLCS